MSQSIDRCPSYNHFAAYITMATFGKTCCCASRSHIWIDNCCVSVRGNDFLHYKSFTAYITMATLCEACCCASRSYCFINYCCVTECGYYSLFYDNLTAYIAMAPFREARCCAGRSYCFINYCRVTECRDIRYIHFIIAPCAVSRFASRRGAAGFSINCPLGTMVMTKFLNYMRFP